MCRETFPDRFQRPVAFRTPGVFDGEEEPRPQLAIVRQADGRFRATVGRLVLFDDGVLSEVPNGGPSQIVGRGRLGADEAEHRISLHRSGAGATFLYGTVRVQGGSRPGTGVWVSEEDQREPVPTPE